MFVEHITCFDEEETLTPELDERFRASAASAFLTWLFLLLSVGVPNPLQNLFAVFFSHHHHRLT
jgi:hypothetical protein